MDMKNSTTSDTPSEQAQPVAWFEAEASARGRDIREVIRSALYSTRMHTTAAPVTSNPVWALYADQPDFHIPQRTPDSAPEPASAREAELLLALQQVTTNAGIWKNLAEYNYGLRVYPDRMELVGGALDALARKHGLVTVRAIDTHPAANAGDLSPVYGWLERAARCGVQEVEHSARTMMAYYQGAEFPDTPAAADAVALKPLAYVRTSELLKLADNRVVGVGMMLHKEQGEGMVPVFDRAPASAAGRTGEHVTMNGHQLKQALELAWPDGAADPVQGETVVNIARWPAGTASDEDGGLVDMPAGLYLAYDDLPSEGMTHLLEDPEGDTPAAKGGAA